MIELSTRVSMPLEAVVGIRIWFCPPTARRECLDWMLIVSQRHLEAVLGEYCAHYNDERPHRSCGLRPPASIGAPIRQPGATTRRRARLGGLLNEYSRAPIAA
jgi:putative transposase